MAAPPNVKGGITGKNSGADIVGLNEFRAALKALDGNWPKELKEAHKTIGDRGAQWGQWEAATGSRMQQVARAAIKGKGTEKDARIRVAQTKAIPFANFAFWGGKRRAGWFADPLRYGAYASPFQPWVGSDWQAASAGEGPYAINPALAKHMDDILETYWKLIDRISHRAFPDN